MLWRRTWLLTPVFLPGEFKGQKEEPGGTFTFCPFRKECAWEEEERAKAKVGCSGEGIFANLHSILGQQVIGTPRRTFWEGDSIPYLHYLTHQQLTCGY